MSVTARRSTLWRHAFDIKDALLDAGCEDWVPSCFALALQSLGLMDLLLRLKIVARQRLQLVQELSQILQAEWGVDLSLFVRNELNLSDSEYDKLRLAFGIFWQALPRRKLQLGEAQLVSLFRARQVCSCTRAIAFLIQAGWGVAVLHR
eukprot:2791303-Pleurochrysis_carterae.AAC.6